MNPLEAFCATCKRLKPKEAYVYKQWQRRGFQKPICLECWDGKGAFSRKPFLETAKVRPYKEIVKAWSAALPFV